MGSRKPNSTKEVCEQSQSTAAEQILTEGNEAQQNTHQTQGWESVKSALDLVQKAKEDKAIRFKVRHSYN